MVFTIESFKKNNSPQKRKEESRNLRIKYPDKIPVIVEGELKKNKYIVDLNLEVSVFMFILRKHISNEVNQGEALFLFAGDKMVCGNHLLWEIFEKQRPKDDEYLYMVLKKENTFGMLKSFFDLSSSGLKKDVIGSSKVKPIEEEIKKVQITDKASKVLGLTPQTTPSYILPPLKLPPSKYI